MPEEIKLSPYEASVSPKDYKSDYYSVTDDSHPESSMYTDHSDRELSRSETSSCSDESGCYKQNGHEAVEIIPTRTIKTSVPKPAANPLQFVKIRPCDLYRTAQKQLQKTCEVKKPKPEVKDEIEDWQSNLDNWKCNRRKQQEHIIERVVEVKKLELEEHDRNRKRTKTFSEMMEERTSKGRKLSLPLYLEEDSEDLSDLGLSSSKNEIKSSPIPEENDESSHEQETEQPCTNGNCNVFDEPDHAQESRCEATYESAIQSYESRMKSITSGNSSSSSSDTSRKSSSTVTSTTTTKSTAPTLRKYGRRSSATKIEEKLSELERIKNRSMSSTDLTEANKKQINIPKVNIFQRKEIFEKISDANDSSKNRRLTDELPPVRSIKDRLSSLGKTVEETTVATSNKTKKVLLTEVSVKDRLSSINEKIRQQNTTTAPEKPAIKERLSSLKASSLDESDKSHKSKDYSDCEPQSKSEDLITPSTKEYSSGRSSSSEDYDHMHQVNHFHHRSLDSLQGRDSPNGFCFERVQSLECIDCCSNYPASVLSGDTDREDSGIHTADVSSSVSQADDFDLHADTSMDVDVKSQNTPAAIVSDETKADNNSSHSDFRFISQHDVVGPLDDADVDKNESNQSGRREEELVDANQTRCSEQFYSEDGHVNQKCDLETTETFNRDEVFDDEAAGQDNQKLGYDDPDTEMRERADDTLSKENIDTCCGDVAEQRKVEESPSRNADEYLEDVTIKEEITPVLNVNHFEKPSYVNQSFTEDETDHTPAVINGIEQNINYSYHTNDQFNQIEVNDLTNVDSVFDFEPSSTAVEPPKEKPPPPPPLDNSDEESGIVENTDCLRRMDSTKRIKKEMRQKRSSFLGIEGYDDDSYLEPELESVKPPPDMTTFLQEERRLEKLLYRQSICSESDSTQGESRDSGVELDKNHNDENSWMPEGVHSRQDSETYANTSTTSEEDEIIKKEREILEILELEEQRHYENESKNECSNLGEKLVLKLKELERQKNVVYWSRENEQPYLNEQHRTSVPQNYQKYEEQALEQRHHQLPEPMRQSADSVLLQQQWAGRSLQDVSQKEASVSPVDCSQGEKTRLDYRSSMPNIQQEAPAVSTHYRRQPPPIPTNKPAHFREPAAVSKASTPQQMSKQTLQALSAVPRSKIVATDSWVLSKKKPRQESYNYQHWLIQEAEHRRITEYQQRQCKENMNHNYVNVHPEYLERTSTHPNEVQGLESRITPTHPNRSALYAHPQMLPYRNHSQAYSNDCKSQQPKPPYNNNNNNNKPLPDSVIQTLTQRVQNRFAISDAAKQKRREISNMTNQQEKMLSVSGKKKCSHCGEELGRGAAMIIESLRLFYHIDCFKCCVCCVQLGDGLMGTDVRVRNSKLHCHSCYSNDEGLKFSCV